MNQVRVRSRDESSERLAEARADFKNSRDGLIQSICQLRRRVITVKGLIKKVEAKLAEGELKYDGSSVESGRSG